MMTIRKSKIEDIPSIMPIYENARDFMSRSGNPHQWINGYPATDDISRDITAGCHYVILSDSGEIVGAFMFRIGHDATYDIIEGTWLNNAPYGVIHRLASSGKTKGIADACFNFCFSLIDNIRVDTHPDNTMMQRAIMRHGFTPTGIIYCHNGTPRLAFHKSL